MRAESGIYLIWFSSFNFNGKLIKKACNYLIITKSKGEKNAGNFFS
jgi:hypothetical protein